MGPKKRATRATRATRASAQDGEGEEEKTVLEEQVEEQEEDEKEGEEEEGAGDEPPSKRPKSDVEEEKTPLKEEEEEKKEDKEEAMETEEEKKEEEEKEEEKKEEKKEDKTKEEEDKKKEEDDDIKEVETVEAKKKDGDDDDEIQEVTPAEKKEEKEVEEKDKPYKRSPELAKFWKAVEDDPSDFTGWTYLLQYVDTNGSVAEGRETYDAFLNKYPYCYGYWKKYADFEKRKGTKEACMEVFQRGLKGIPLSADLWIHYLTYVKAEYKEDPVFIRKQYERSVKACGREWRSDKLWDNYVKWESQDQKNFANVLKIYDRIIRNPTQGLSHQFEMFRDFVKEKNPKDILDINDFLALRKEVLESLNKEKEKKKKEKEEKEGGDKDKDEAEDEPEAGGGDLEDDAPPGEDDEKPASDEENQAMRERIIFGRKKFFKETEEKVQTRWKFEDQIKRPYFHMKPLERGQLKNWNEYLDHEIKAQEDKKEEDKDDELVTVLFERCLIACALYEEFWLKYANWLRAKKDGKDRSEQIRDVYHRAITHHLPTKVDIHLQFSAFEEDSGNFDAAVEILKKCESKHPEMLSLLLRRINLERRRGNIPEVHALYKDCIDKAKKAASKSDLAVKYARFLRLHQADTAAAKAVLEKAIAGDAANPKLYLQILDIQLHTSPLDPEAVIRTLETAKEACGKVNPKHTVLFSQRKVEFLEDFGTDVKDLLAAQAAHQKLQAEARKEAAKGDDSKAGEGKGIKTVEGRGGSGHKSSNGSSASTASYGAAGNSASYGAHHNSAYQQYGARYNSSYGSYGQGGSAGYGSYYDGSSGAAGGHYGGHYGSHYGGSGY